MSAIRPVVLGLAGAAALTATLSACGSAHPSVAAAADAAARQSHAAPAGKAPSPRARVATPPTADTPTRPCAAADLTITPAQRRVTQGVQVERFTVTTADPAGCTIDGVPNLVPKGPLSARVPGATVDLALSQQDFPSDLNITPPRPATVPLTPGKSASFYLAWFSASPKVCVQSSGFSLNAPGDTTYTDMQTMTYPIGPICDGVFYVSAVF